MLEGSLPDGKSGTWVARHSLHSGLEPIRETDIAPATISFLQFLQLIKLMITKTGIDCQSFLGQSHKIHKYTLQGIPVSFLENTTLKTQYRANSHKWHKFSKTCQVLGNIMACHIDFIERSFEKNVL
ncbi:MAG: hypothetical protein A3F50_01435 [Candidatus Yanofskybacteria bacterium RIFCSPHIGHO2_12_FULL_44_29b]|nr:MAG: hypothetical protein A3F50_01435 [Candidatus Yanofskybacteria bacterium RIFCSPHIGHO2_12_FULL_44_29b]